MGIGTFFNKDKSALTAALAKVEELNNVIEKKDLEIEELRGKLDNKEKNSLSLEDYEYLYKKLENSEREKEELKNKVNSLENFSQSILSTEQIELMEKNLKKTKEENKILIEKVSTLELKIKTVENSSVSPRQMELMERNLKNARKENLDLQEKLSHYQEVAKEVVKIQVEQKPMEFSDNVEILDKFKYKILVEDFFNATKFKEIKDFLVKKEFLFINDIDLLENIEGIDKCKNFKSANVKFKNFKKGIVPLDDRILLCKGARVQKIFKSYRKFTNYLLDNNMEFMDNLDGVDFKALSVKASIMAKSVKDIMIVAENYFETYKIK